MNVAHIIIIDDDDIIAEIAADALGAVGHMISEMADGAAALDRIREVAPDLVILDYDLPGATGMEILRQIRQRAYTRDMPVMMLTGNGSRLLKARAEHTGADDYLVKPFDPDELVRRVEALLLARRHHG